MGFPHDWAAMLKSDLGISEFGFRSLLLRRHDMQDDAALEESEKRMVETLKRRHLKDEEQSTA